MTNAETTIELELAVLANMLAHPAEAFDLITKAGIDYTYFTEPACINAFNALLQADANDKKGLIKTALAYLPNIKTAEEKNEFFARADPITCGDTLYRFAENALRRLCKSEIDKVFANKLNIAEHIGDRVKSITNEMDTRIAAVKVAFGNTEKKEDTLEIDGTKPMPEELMGAPGFIDDYIRFALSTAPRPNRVLAFSGALAILSLLAARKYQTVRKGTPHLYIVALADSGVGKNHARHINKMIASDCNMCDAIADRIASGEGLEDALAQTPAMLFQIDEFDTLLNAMKNSTGLSEGVYAHLLSLFSESLDTHYARKKAKSGEHSVGPGKKIYAPSVTLYATAIPSRFYDSLSKRAMDNGFLARFQIFEAGRRGESGDLCASETLPYEIKNFTHALAAKPNPIDRLPTPQIVPDDVGATERAKAITREADALYDKCVDQNDDAGKSIWNRGAEMTEKLALLYALSENPILPKITVKGLDWAWKIVRYSAKRMLAMAKSYVSTDQYDADANAVLRKIRSYGAKGALHSTIAHSLGYSKKRFCEAIETLIDRDLIIKTPGYRGAFVYHIKQKGKRDE